MATGRQHALATAIAGGTLAAGLYVIFLCPLSTTVTFACGCLTGLVISPDLDIRQSTHAERVMRNSAGQFGRFLAWVWFWVWWPYAHFIPRHRHPLSHMPLLGTVLRLVYLSALLGAIYALLDWLFVLPAFSEISSALISLIPWWLAGLVIVDALHAVMDTKPGEIISKRIFRFETEQKITRRQLQPRTKAAKPARSSQKK